jgi:formylglycine-generating enzyme required for sulfatase activity
MALYGALLKVVGKAALNAVGGGIAGEVLCEVLPEAARKVVDWWAGGKSPEQRRAEVQALAQAPPAEVQQVVHQVVADVAADQSPEVRKRLSVYLSLVPAAARASLRRPSDPTGRHAHGDFADEDSILPLLPTHLPRFQPGDRPLPGIDWELDELLGAGGFGEVWRAKNPHFDAVPPVALKFCLDPSARDRLLRHEAAVLNQVMRQGRHPGIVTLQHTYLSADPPCLEYEYVAGGDLSGLLRDWQGHPPGPERVGQLMSELAGIVAFAHRLNPPIVHRDLKPANILVQPGSGGKFTLRVADFGIGGVAASQAVAASVRGVSQGNFLVSALRGAHTPLYASPQQMRGGPPDPRDDVYALGVIWYQLLTCSLVAGRPGGTRWTSRLVNAGVPAAQIDLLSACLEDDPADRPADAGVLVERLNALLSSHPTPPPPEEREPAAAPSSPLHVSKEPAVAPSPLPRQLVNSLGMRFVLIPPGTYYVGSPADEAMRGSDEPLAQWVRLEKPFYLGIFPVTQKEYEAVMRCNPSFFQKKTGGGKDHPVEQVSWEEAVSFCRKLSDLADEKAAGRHYRLPSEQEWEIACRAGTTTPFAFGAALSSTQANFDGTRPYGDAAVGPFRRSTTRVGSFPPNPWGLYDMHGNVWEWCADWYTPGQHRVLRGGSWNNSGHLCRSARRQKYAMDFRGDTIGFRVALDVTA